MVRFAWTAVRGWLRERGVIGRTDFMFTLRRAYIAAFWRIFLESFRGGHPSRELSMLLSALCEYVSATAVDGADRVACLLGSRRKVAQGPSRCSMD